MAEYIDRVEAMNIIAGGKNDNAYFGTTNKDWEVIDFLKDVPTADVIEREKVVEDMKTLYDEIYHLVKTENWDKEREIESKIITQALDVINDYIENFTKE